MIRVMLVDDDKNALDAIKLNLEVADDIRVVLCCSNGQEALSSFALIQPDVIVMDINMPILNGLDSCKAIRALSSSVKIIMLTMFKEKEHLLKAFDNECDGFIYKGITREDLIRVIRNVNSGLITIDQEAQKMLLGKNILKEKLVSENASSMLKSLNRSEVEIVEHVMLGKSNKEISSILQLSEGYIRNQLVSIRRKVGVKNTIELGVWGAKMGL